MFSENFQIILNEIYHLTLIYNKIFCTIPAKILHFYRVYSNPIGRNLKRCVVKVKTQLEVLNVKDIVNRCVPEVQLATKTVRSQPDKNVCMFNLFNQVILGLRFHVPMIHLPIINVL